MASLLEEVEEGLADLAAAELPADRWLVGHDPALRYDPGIIRQEYGPFQGAAFSQLKGPCKVPTWRAPLESNHLHFQASSETQRGA